MLYLSVFFPFNFLFTVSSKSSRDLKLWAEDKLMYDEERQRFSEADLNGSFLNEEFFLVDNETGKSILLTKEEKERIFLDSMQSYYFSGENTLSDDQFDRLKADLTWEVKMFNHALIMDLIVSILST